MSDERFTSNEQWIAEGTIVDICDNGKVIMQVFDNDNIQNVVDLLNELSTSCRQLEREVKSLNAFLVHKGFAEEYIRWKGDD